MIGSAIGDPISNAIIEALQKDSKERDEAIEKATNAIVDAIELSDSITNMRKLTASGALSAAEYKELTQEATTVGRALLSSSEGQSDGRLLRLHLQ